MYSNSVTSLFEQKPTTLSRGFPFFHVEREHLPFTGHMGITKTITHVKQSFIRYNMAKDIEFFCQIL